MNIGKENETVEFKKSTGELKEGLESISSSNVKYEYGNTKSGFRFTFYRPLGQKYVQDKMSKTDIAVLEAIKRNNYVRTSEIAKALSISDKTVYRSIKKLKELGYIVRRGDDYSGYWEVC